VTTTSGFLAVAIRCLLRTGTCNSAGKIRRPRRRFAASARSGLFNSARRHSWPGGGSLKSFYQMATLPQSAPGFPARLRADNGNRALSDDLATWPADDRCEMDGFELGRHGRPADACRHGRDGASGKRSRGKRTAGATLCEPQGRSRYRARRSRQKPRRCLDLYPWIYTRVGWPVEITAEFENWRRIRDSEGSEGWVYHSLLSGKRMATVQLKSKTALAPLYDRPDPKSAVTAQLQVGVLGAVKLCTGTWCQISGEGFDGWIEQNELWGVYPDEKIE
jgi:SH3-like domain-containing protein